MLNQLLNAPKDAPVFLSPKLEEEFILKAYALGLFPWTTKPVNWWCPDPRCVLEPHKIHIQKNMKKFMNLYEIRLDFDFLALITLCKNARVKSWIDEEFIEIYHNLFKQGFAHSLELYEQDELVGGIYGLIIGKMFFGESMVSLRKNASKIAMIKLCELLAPYDFLIDCQVHNKHLEFMGAQNIPREDFLKILDKKCQSPSGFETFKDLLF
ncbi:leucyl/phenylalanyl-tRNA--protein transferase [Campylobacter helveticus]|uniref:Leucyl/phenylalanyl-tRNA--protein transferase n=1 Tax=Campylobacter helveticus TaxID=28898 RepID=A0AAX2UMD3_9BACT|nr:leucyl/phenylalanyl-tRNA--protein transferase [Campylobacter helveticus]EDP7906283.1 leucyl/phenylalanyl-tRNA--protein transferase [Campylobacter upsaliensis]ARE80989.1 leucyl, phenylalanyl-tRNA-protein transferase [Campylobacter helveticus]MCR2039199.1 leucyl/phenylalanyl-tRNA--protein transferase [Campylobacter helveticus]MCR2054037.1 leucyl/phenylalanyl-tRNA--protein transferase [Campylobacter helveticus]MCR2056090.1 leucyl/phenylalanyl-tRNA--protein transferase [Campylobacter helveticus